MLNKYSENDPDFPGSPMSLADLFKSLFLYPSAINDDVLLSWLQSCFSSCSLPLSRVTSLTSLPADHPSHEVSQAISSSQNSAASHAYWAPLFWCHMTFQTTPSTLLPLLVSEINTQLSKPDTWESPLIWPSLHTCSLEPVTSHIQSLGSFPKSLCDLSHSNVLAQINISTGLFQQPLHWSSLLAPFHSPSLTPPLCLCTCCPDGLSLG